MTDTVFTNDELMQMLKIADSKIKVFEEKERINYITVIKKFGDKYSDEELEKKDLKSLEAIADAVKRFVPSDEKPEIVPIVSNKLLVKEAKGASERIDFTSVFDDVAKDFNMSKIKIIKKE